MKPTRLENLRQGQSEGKPEIAATIEIEGERHEVWFRASQGPLASGPEPFLAATLVPAMRAGGPLEIPTAVSPKLLDSTDKIQEIFHCWYPDYKKIPIDAPGKPGGAPPDGRGVGCFFSGGVDSYYSVLRHQEEITTLILVHGFDIELENVALRQRVTAMIREAAERLGKHLIEIETNLRDFCDAYANWPTHQFGAALAAVAMMLAPQLRKVYFPASLSYRDLTPCGSHPLIDPLWSTEEMEVILDGLAVTRLQKVARVASSEVAMKSLRVCWENPEGAYNCCKCEKCLRTMIELQIHDALHKCTAFDHPLDLRRIARIDVTDKYHKIFVEESLGAVEQTGKHPQLAKALRDALDRKYYRGLWRVGRWVVTKSKFLRSLYRWWRVSVLRQH